MMNRTAIALGLAIATGVGFAAPGQNAASADMKANAGVSGTQQQTRTSASTSADVRFDALDTNGDGMLSREEAAANGRVSALYESLDTSETIEDRERESTPGGITRAQFEAGMQALGSKSGSVGPAVSGGETYTIMRDGSRKLKENASATSSNTAARARDAASVANSATGAAGGTAAAGDSEAQIQRERAQNQAESMQNRARGGYGEARSEAEVQRDRARDKASEMQRRARGQTEDRASEAYGTSRSRDQGMRDSIDDRRDTGTAIEYDTRLDAD